MTDLAETRSNLPYRVRAIHCDHRADREAVYRALRRATDPLSEAWDRLEAARTIVIKFNQDWPLHRIAGFAGVRQQLVSDQVAYAVLRLLRERTQAKLYCADVSFHVLYGYVHSPAESTSLAPLLREFGVEYLDGTRPPFQMIKVPGGGVMFTRYLMMKQVVEADAVVSVTKMKNHGLTGFTASLKNLFGLMPGPPYWRPRHYYHHRVRIPYVLVDLGRILNPALNIVDALTGQAGMEWGDDPAMGRIVDALIAGDHPVATDACTVYLMGHDPLADYPTSPFYRERNMLRVASEQGFGTADLREIDFLSEVDPMPPGVFFAEERYPRKLERERRRTTCEQALYYASHREEFASYADEYILLQQGKVRWHGKDGAIVASHREEWGEYPEQAMYLKFVDEQEIEGEHYEIYRQVLSALKAQ